MHLRYAIFNKGEINRRQNVTQALNKGGHRLKDVTQTLNTGQRLNDVTQTLWAVLVIKYVLSSSTLSGLAAF